MKILKTPPGERLFLGHRGENLALNVVFNIAPWVELYGFGTAHLLHQRNNDDTPYPVATVQDGLEVSWAVSDADTAIEGHGKYELRYYVGEALVKSSVGETYVGKALVYGATPPDPIQGWLDHVTEKESEILEAARMAAVAEAAAERSEQSSLEAKAAQEVAVKSEENASASEKIAAIYTANAVQSANEAKKSAENAATSEGNAKESEQNAVNAQKAAVEAAEDAKLLEQQAEQSAKTATTKANTASDFADYAAKSMADAHTQYIMAWNAATKAEIFKQNAAQSAAEAKEAALTAKGINVTAKPGQLIRVKSVDENGKPTAWEAVPWGYTEGGMVEIPLTINWQEIADGDGDGVPDASHGLINTPIGLEVGKSYVVKFNGTDYPVVGQDLYEASDGGTPGVYLGNMGVIESEPGEPFCVIEFPEEIATEAGFNTQIFYSGGQVPFAIYKNDTVIHPIPGKLLPEGVPYVEQGELVEILPETTLTENAEDPGQFVIDENAPVLEIGKTYIVNLNGTEYTCVGQDMSAMAPGAVLLGNLGAVDGTIGTGEPFVMVSALNGETQAAMVLSFEDINELTLSIKEMTGTVHKLDNRCLDLAWLPTMTVGMGEVQAETALNQSSTDIDTYYFESTCSFEVGKNYTIIIGDVEYDAVAFDGAVIGLEIGTFITDNIENISFICTPGEFVSYTSSVSPGGSTTIKILGETEIHNKLPKEFLPDDVADSPIVVVSVKSYDEPTGSIVMSHNAEEIVKAQVAGKIVFMQVECTLVANGGWTADELGKINTASFTALLDSTIVIRVDANGNLILPE